VNESEVRLTEAQLALERAQRLSADRLNTPADLDTARAQVDSFLARIAAAREQVRVAERQIDVERTNLDNTVVRAPFSGVAVSKDAQPGEMVSPNSAGGGFTRTGICTLVDMRSLEVEVDVNETYINRVEDGQPVTVVLNAYPDWQIPAHVITTVPKADRQKATVLVRIGFAALDPRILPDMGVKVTFMKAAAADEAGGARPVVLVPKTAVRSENDQSYAYVVNAGIVDRRAVRAGGTDGDRLEIAAGLASGERVILSPPAGLASGATVVTR
jgi:HlyD family secretion protein